MSNQKAYQNQMESWPKLKHLAHSEFISSLNQNLFYYADGEHHQTKLLMIHGLGDEADTWRYTILDLMNKHHVIALDLPGFGRSDKPKQAYTPDFLIRSIIGLMDQLEIDSSILMGSSLGGILAHALAIQHPERTTGLVLVGGALLQQKPMTDMSLKMMQIPLLGEWLYTRLRKDPDAAYQSLRTVYYDLDNLPQDDRDFLYRRVNQRVWSSGQRRAYFSTLRNLTPWVMKSQKDLPKRLKKLAVPTLVIRGEHDTLFPYQNALAIKESQPDVTVAHIENCGHLPHQEDPEAFNSVLKNWLGKLN